MATKKYINEFKRIIENVHPAKGCFALVSESNRDMVQKKTSITKPIQKYLYERYDRFPEIKFTFLNKFEDIKYEGEIELDNKALYENYSNLFYYLSQEYRFKQFNKYRKYSIKGFEGDNVVFTYIDSIGNEKERKESVLLLKKYVTDIKYLKSFCNNSRHIIDAITSSTKIKFQYKITNNINDKLKVVQMNSKRGSCQARKERVSPGNYAWGLYDFFNNGCIAPLIVYHEGEIVGRSAFRVFFDEEGKRYINLERMFGHGHLINNLDAFCYKLTEDLFKLNETLTVSEKFSVTNTYKINPWFYALTNERAKKKFVLERLKINLRQPKRLYHPDIKQGYYQDSLINTIHKVNDNVIYDAINPNEMNALHIIKMK